VKYQIPTNCPEMPNPRENGPRGDGLYSAKAAAQLLNVSISTINRWCAAGKLESTQAIPYGPHWIMLTPETIQRLRKPVKQSRKNGQPLID
jgi:hypothetical protein